MKAVFNDGRTVEILHYEATMCEVAATKTRWRCFEPNGFHLYLADGGYEWAALSAVRIEQ